MRLSGDGGHRVIGDKILLEIGKKAWVEEAAR
jgi:hypothetical protein